MKHPYTTVHDLRDIFSIYHDCRDYEMKFWNFTDQRYETLAPVGIWVLNSEWPNEEQDIRLMFHVTTPDDPCALTTVGDFEDYVNDYMEKCSVLDDAQVVVLTDYNHNMEVTFTGSSNPEKQVNYNIDYTDGFRNWKRWLNWKRIVFKCFLAKLALI